MSTISLPLHNRLLSALSTSAQQRLLPDIELVGLKRGQTLHEAGSLLHHAYFPVESIVSLQYALASGAMSEVSVVGNEGFAGTSICNGISRQVSTAIVSKPGAAYRIAAQPLQREFARHEDFQRLAMGYMQVVITQITQTAACNRHHSIDKQVSRWLLTMLDRTSGNRVYMTQEAIAAMLGVRREGVTTAAFRLQQRGIIQYHRGVIVVLDRFRLEDSSCECYRVVSGGDARLQLPGPAGAALRYASRQTWSPGQVHI